MIYLNRPLRFAIVAPLQLGPQQHLVPLTHSEYPAESASPGLSFLEFKRLLARYKRACYEWGQFWLQQQPDSLNGIPHAFKSLPMPVNILIEPFVNPDWIIQDWQIKFVLSDKLLTMARKQSALKNWYEDPLVVAIWQEAICVCYNSIQKYHRTFGTLPVVGDRLFNEDTGLLVQDRSIDGGLMTVTFTLDC